jgi:transcriptional regulator with XRE-family HTH domain
MDAACRAEFGQRTRESRTRMGLTRDALGQQVGRGGDWIYSIEAGRQTPDPMHLYKLADALKVQSRWLATGATPQPESTEAEFNAWLAEIAGLAMRLPDEARTLVAVLAKQVADTYADRNSVYHVTQAIEELPDHPDSPRVRRQLLKLQRELAAQRPPESPAPRAMDRAPRTRSSST